MDSFAEWLRVYAWAAWGGLGLVLAVLELFTLDLTLLMLASGAVAGGITALIFPGLLWLQVIVALVVAVLTLLLLRPTLLNKVRNAPGYRSSLDSLVGASGRATAQITRTAGEVKVQGQVWEARPFDPDVTIDPGDEVEVYGIDGVTLLVYPVHPGGQIYPT